MEGFKGAAAAAARAFWLYQGVAIAGVLIASAPDKSRLYAAAQLELAQVSRINVTSEQITDFLRTKTRQEREEVRGVIVAGAATAKVSVDPRFELRRYVDSDPNPLPIDFSTMTVDDILKFVDETAPNRNYKVLTAVLSKDAVARALQGQTGVLADGQIGCGADRQMCETTLALKPIRQPTVQLEVVRFLSPSREVVIRTTPLDAIDFYVGPKAAGVWTKMPSTRQLPPVIRTETAAKAIERLRTLEASSQDSVSAFGVSFSGPIARLIFPVALAALAVFAWSHAIALRATAQEVDPAAEPFLPLLPSRPAAVGRLFLMLFPLAVGAGALWQAADVTRPVTWLTGIGLAVQLVATCFTFREFARTRAAMAQQPATTS